MRPALQHIIMLIERESHRVLLTLVPPQTRLVA